MDIASLPMTCIHNMASHFDLTEDAYSLRHMLSLNRQFSDMRHMFIKRIDTNPLSPDDLPNVAAFMANWGPKIKEISAEFGGETNPFIQLCFDGHIPSLTSLVNAETLSIDAAQLLRIGYKHNIQSFPNLKSLSLVWTYNFVQDPAFIETISSRAPQLKKLTLVCLNDGAIMPELLYANMPTVSRFPPLLEDLAIDAHIYVMDVHQCQNLKKLSMTRTVMQGYLPETLEYLEMRACAVISSTPYDAPAAHWLSQCKNLKHLTFSESSLAQNIPEPVWRDVIGQSLEVYEDFDTCVRNCQNTRHLMRVRTFTVTSDDMQPASHCFAVPKSPYLQYVFMKGVMTLQLSDFFVIRRLPYVTALNCVFGNIPCAEFTGVPADAVTTP